MLRFFEQIQHELTVKNAFVVYRKPNTSLVKAVFQCDAELNYVRDFTETGFVFAPFDGLDKTVLIYPNKTIETDSDLKIENEEAYISPETFSISKAKEFHIDLVAKGISAIEERQLQKVVLSRKIELKSTKQPIDLFKTLLKNYSNALCYLWYHPKVGMWLGATPEVLLQTKNNSFETSSLAATQLYKGNDNPIWGAKETEEQELVTQFIKTALKDKVENLKVGKRMTIKAGNLLHLRTLITGRMQNNLSVIVSALHPTPATCGLPKENAKQFILENENYHREYYTGFLGELNLKEETHRSRSKRNIENRAYSTIKTVSNLYVNLRCASILGNIATIFVGGGITEQSNPQKEWEETIAKSNTMLRILLK